MRVGARRTESWTRQTRAHAHREGRAGQGGHSREGRARVPRSEEPVWASHVSLKRVWRRTRTTAGAVCDGQSDAVAANAVCRTGKLRPESENSGAVRGNGPGA